ncbi:MAG: glycosyltransferase family 2 protein [Planctomycetales bacterium]|jgi:cellulose synthase/poly-beta-1,6-N-acetylglucosamine synthase-like glycosyltransferase|nr:glycosyltransferase family 2 protein [Planctomycetales bacterium]
MILVTYASVVISAQILFCFLINLVFFRRSPHTTDTEDPLRVSVLIPARNESKRIRPVLQAILESEGVVAEILVLDDQSEDSTAEVVNEFCVTRNNVRLIRGIPVPQGWNGKQFACYQLAQQATYEELVFLDADVLLAKDALCRAVLLRRQIGVELLSGFPRQRVVSLGEVLLIPLIHLLLLCFLPFVLMRSTRMRSAAAGCGQFFLTTKSFYAATGGHAAIRSSLHDGIMLPRSYRKSGFQTDLFDASDIATCRMYDSLSEVWSGLSKNAHEGFANMPLLLFLTPVMYLAFIHPILILLASTLFAIDAQHGLLLLFAVVLGYIPRGICCLRFDRAWLGCLLNPISVAMFLQVQWAAWFNRRRGRSIEWRARKYETTTI